MTLTDIGLIICGLFGVYVAVRYVIWSNRQK